MSRHSPGVGMTGFASMEPSPVAELNPKELEELKRASDLLGGRRLAVLTGAGLSTDSGIPDYRGPGSAPRNPMTFQEFIGSEANRRRYWARNHIGWSHLRHADPNAGHAAVALLERRGLLTGLITQNVDRLHEDAGSINVVDLHGRYDQVVCLDNGHTFSRRLIAAILEEINPGFLEAAVESGVVEVAPDADATVEDSELITSFVMAVCPICGGTLKPDFVYFGENVPKDRVARAYEMVDNADALLVAGSSLTVQSGLRFVRHSAKAGKPVVIINRGTTRGDEFAQLKLELGVSGALDYLARTLPDLPGASEPIGVSGG
ncbi:NAD-dependent protein deacetylase [Paenarthrobacter aurescens]|uniref:NAD-dependent protein deacetylase n=1 Tax=Paenarthrobacter aurescens TaxID=43663 RepID=UPI0011450A1B|nr:NAD-dependent protein deacetylase [Paenarthrobacter aurescens]MDO6143858.1 NAD-dependent protein deacetylase [Paenarthrobacter aurescens]MDO6147705.1 NAD-dependent protein deacetylase [Paenarthrobacter aurescens]MDO6158949.1 NAD-dependent protein deacetylase [Paenarthrobacter aurescens]MDO6162933.1 NAD-dependent protein deacetylase [Paenarthrobacter aurescens]